MLDYFAIFTKGGALLWTLQFTTALKHSPLEALNALIRTCLLEERSADHGFTFAPKMGAAQTLKWTFDNRLGLVFVAVYQRALPLGYVDELLASVKALFGPVYAPGVYAYPQFTATFQKAHKECEARADAARRPLQQKAPVANGAAKAAAAAANGRQSGKGGASGGGGAVRQDDKGEDVDEDGEDATPLGTSPEGSGDEAGAGNANGQAHDANGVGDIDRSKLAKLGSRKDLGAARRGRRPAAKDKDEDSRKAATDSDKKKGFSFRSGSTKETAEQLDFSDKAATGAATSSATVDYGAGGLSRMDEEDEEWGEEDDAAIEELGKAAQNGGTAPAKRGVLGSFVSSLALRVVGTEALTAADLAPALEGLRRKLMERNVAQEIAGQICESVARSLEGQRLSSFTGVSRFVCSAFEDALHKILNKRQVDVLHDIERSRAKGRPYVIVFCGVNGVGKSTNLAKIAYWLGGHGCKVLLAACDTFRAGAVEQLKTHAMRLGVPLYERGYEKDPAKVAAEAVRVAQRDGRDVVLVDTAGRMQDNEPLMRALASLIHVNNPDLVLFVGEALVGNDAVDQLVKFNRALYDLAPRGATQPHNIDGIVLTKFDTIDDKVGAALSMVYSSGAPVMFVGCGQTYVDLKRLNVKSVVRSLLS